MLDQVLSRALRLTVADIDSDGEVVIARRIACIHEAQVELAARMTVELGSESAASAALRTAASQAYAADVADYLHGAADLLTPDSTTAPADATAEAETTTPARSKDA